MFYFILDLNEDLMNFYYLILTFLYLLIIISIAQILQFGIFKF